MKSIRLVKYEQSLAGRFVKRTSFSLEWKNEGVMNSKRGNDEDMMKWPACEMERKKRRFICTVLAVWIWNLNPEMGKLWNYTLKPWYNWRSVTFRTESYFFFGSLPRDRFSTPVFPSYSIFLYVHQICVSFHEPIQSRLSWCISWLNKLLIVNGL